MVFLAAAAGLVIVILVWELIYDYPIGRWIENRIVNFAKMLRDRRHGLDMTSDKAMRNAVEEYYRQHGQQPPALPGPPEPGGG